MLKRIVVVISGLFLIYSKLAFGVSVLNLKPTKIYKFDALQPAIAEALCPNLAANSQLCLANKKELIYQVSGLINPKTFAINNPLNLKQVNVYKLEYTMPIVAKYWHGKSLHKLSGVVLIPEIKPQQIKGVILYFHATAFDRYSVPSQFQTNIQANRQDKLLAAIYASQGYIVVAPDYIGLGEDAILNTVHPYTIYPELNALSGLFMLKTLRELLDQHQIKQELNLYFSSYSEGGAYALWASYLAQHSYLGLVQDNLFKLKAAIGISGAYDLSGTMLKFMQESQNNLWLESQNQYNISPGSNASSFMPNYIAYLYNFIPSKAALAAYFVVSYSYYYNSPLTELVFNNFASLESCAILSESTISIQNCYLDQMHYLLLQLFNTNKSITQDKLVNYVLSAGMANKYFLGNNKTLAAVEQAKAKGLVFNSVNSFILPRFLNDPKLKENLELANIYNWKTKSPLIIIALKYDSVVSNLNAKKACSETGVLGQSGENLVKCITIDNTKFKYEPVKGVTIFMDHPQLEAISNLVALAHIKSLK